LERGILGPKLLCLSTGRFGLASPVGSTTANIGDALFESLALDLKLRVFLLPTVAAASEEPSLNLLGSGIDWLVVLLACLCCRVHAEISVVGNPAKTPTSATKLIPGVNPKGTPKASIFISPPQPSPPRS
jgi:hypothetical protein